MLKDKARVEAYQTAILSNKSLIEGKVILDVGAGTGILSLFCAKAGAKHVYAVEAASNLIPIIKDIIQENNFSEIITVIEADVEDLPDVGVSSDSNVLQRIPELVDVIVSEWMGFFLLHECMIESIISARRFLKEDGIMFPDECSIYVALCELPEYHDTWDEFHSFNLSSFGKKLRNSLQSEPQICYIKDEVLLSKPIKIFTFEPKYVEKQDLEIISDRHVLPAARNGKYQGLCLWFTVSFPSSGEKIILSTSPSSQKTHWKQTVIVFPDEIPVEEFEPVAFDLCLRKNGPRTYEISYTAADAEESTHLIPCDCYRMKCQIIKAYLNKEEQSEP